MGSGLWSALVCTMKTNMESYQQQALGPSWTPQQVLYQSIKPRQLGICIQCMTLTGEQLVRMEYQTERGVSISILLMYSTGD